MNTQSLPSRDASGSERHIIDVPYGLNDLDYIVQTYLMRYWRAGRIFAFSGEIGSGKTTLLRAFLRRVGINVDILSPTYAYLYAHKSFDGLNVCHLDLYRVNSITAFYEIEHDNFWQADNTVSVIEWPQVIAPLLNEPSMRNRVVWVDLRYSPDVLNRRLFSIRWNEENVKIT